MSQLAATAPRRPTALVSCLIAVFATLALLAPAASADNVTYIAGDGNVWLSSPDGATKHQVTSNATADSKYRSPSEQNDGTVVAIRKGDSSTGFAWFFDPDTGTAKSNWLLPKSGTGLAFSPFTGGEIAPVGGLFVYDFFHAEGYPSFSSWPEVAFVAGPGLTDPCTINCHDDYLSPRWIPGTNFAGFVDDHFQGAWVQNGSAPQAWVGFTGFDTDSFDVSGQGRSIFEVSGQTAPPQGQPEPADLVLMQNNGTPPNGSPTVLCSLANFANSGADPKWSPDGSMIAWEGPDGVYLSPAPQPQGAAGPSAVCSLTPKLIAPNGSDPDWGPRNVPGGGGGGGAGGGTVQGPKCGGKKPTLVGNARANVLRGTPRADVIDGLGGKDKLIGLKGNDRLCGGAARDTLKGGPGKDMLIGGAGRDVLAGGPGRDKERQ